LRSLATWRKRLSAVGFAVLVTAAPVLGQTSASNPSTSNQSRATKHTSAHKSTSKSRRHRTASRRKRGQQKIDAQRAQQIQEALIREHYLTGKPSGVWDDATQQAMQKYQAENGWQSKTTPDSRALIKLGLGPDNGHLLNPESAMTSQAQPANTNTSAPAAPPNDPQESKK